jgi:transcriptional regulator with XRE-family HTH domain
MTEGNLGAKVRRLRREREMTVSELAANVGVSRPTIWAWEKGKHVPRPGRISSLAQALDVPEDQLILSERPHASEGSLALDNEIERSKARVAKLARTSPDQVEIILKKQ